MSRAEGTREPGTQPGIRPSAGGIGPTFGCLVGGPSRAGHTPAQEMCGPRAGGVRRVRQRVLARTDRQRAYPEEFVRAFHPESVLRRADPGRVRRAWVTPFGRGDRHRGNQPCRRNPGTAHAQMYIIGALLPQAPRPKNDGGCRPSRAEVRCRHSASRKRRPAATRRRSARKRSGTAMSTWSTARSAGPRGCRTPISCSSSRAPRCRHPAKKHAGLSLFLVDLREANGAVRAEPIRVMMNNQNYAVTIRDLVVPAENRIGEEGRGFRYLLDGLNTERILIAAECIGDGRWFIESACDYSKERVVFDRPIGKKKYVVPHRPGPHRRRVRRSDVPASLGEFRRQFVLRCGGEHGQTARLRGVVEAANACLDTFGGNGFAADYDVDRKFPQAGSTRWRRWRKISTSATSRSTSSAYRFLLRPSARAGSCTRGPLTTLATRP